MCDEPEPYRGPFVVLAPDPFGYRVSIDPPPPGDDPTRAFQHKTDAWRYASDLWTALRCPLRDLTDHNTARADPSTARKSPQFSLNRSARNIALERRRNNATDL